MLKVLIAEDELMIADLLDATLTASGYKVCGVARTVAEAVALGKLHKPDLAVLDVRLARGDGGPAISRRLNSRGKVGVYRIAASPFPPGFHLLPKSSAPVAQMVPA